MTPHQASITSQGKGSQCLTHLLFPQMGCPSSIFQGLSPLSWQITGLKTGVRWCTFLLHPSILLLCITLSCPISDENLPLSFGDCPPLNCELSLIDRILSLFYPGPSSLLSRSVPSPSRSSLRVSCDGIISPDVLGTIPLIICPLLPLFFLLNIRLFQSSFEMDLSC